MDPLKLLQKVITSSTDRANTVMGGLDAVKAKVNEVDGYKYWTGKPQSEESKMIDNMTMGFMLGTANPSKYLYHGTNEEVLDNITKEGLKPMRRGLLSLSKDEGYAKSFARSGMTPEGKTSPVMLRVNADLLKGKTISSGQPRPVSDQLNEILTKEVIPPEFLEVMKNGKWLPLREAFEGVTKLLK